MLLDGFKEYDFTILSESSSIVEKIFDSLEKAGMIFSGVSPTGHLCEIAELPKSKHPFFLGTQFHPELKARPLAPHPLFTAFIKAAIKNKKK
jgi:CTP synthase